MSKAIHRRSGWSKLISTFLVLAFAFSVTTIGYVADGTEGVSTALADNYRHDRDHDRDDRDHDRDDRDHDRDDRDRDRDDRDRDRTRRSDDGDESAGETTDGSSAEVSSTAEPPTPEPPADEPQADEPGKPSDDPADDPGGKPGDDPADDPGDNPADDPDGNPGDDPADDTGDDPDTAEPEMAVASDPGDEADPAPATAVLPPIITNTVDVTPSGQGVWPWVGDDNFTGCPIGTTSFKIDKTPTNGTYDLPGGGTIEIYGATDYSFNYTATGVLVQRVIVKASSGAHVYDYIPPDFLLGVRGDTNLLSVLKADMTGFYQISHVTFCFIEDPTAEISGMKWEDLDGDSLWDNGTEDLLPGWTIYLDRLYPDGSIEWTIETQTDGNGQYSFTDIMPGTYEVHEDESDPNYVRTYGGCVFTVGDDGMITLLCHEEGPGRFDFGNMPFEEVLFKKTFSLTAADLDTRFGNDVSYFVTFKLGDALVLSELALSSSAPHVATLNDLPTGTKITDVSWWATVDGIDYLLGYQAGPEFIEESDLLNEHDYDIRIHGYKFEDVNDDTDWDELDGEDGLSGWVIELYKADGTFVARTTTGDGGYYEFTGLLPGEYYVVEVIPPSEPQWTQTYGSEGDLDDVFELAWGDSHREDFGNHEREFVSIDGYKFFDVNGNTIWDKNDGEDGLSGWTIELYRVGDSNPIATTITGDGGYYKFTGLEPGSYYVVEVIPNVFPWPWEQTFGPTSSDDKFDLDWGETHQEDFGNWRQTPGGISGYKYNDINGDGDWDLTDSELGIEFWFIDLYRVDVLLPIATYVTDASGYYEFTGLAAGDYHVDERQRGNWAQTDGIGGYDFTVLADGTVVTDPPRETFDFGNREREFASIEGYKFLDVNHDGDWDENDGEVGDPGWTIELYQVGVSNSIATTITGAGGYYKFTGLEPGSYYVVEVIPPGSDWYQTYGSTGSGDAFDLTWGDTHREDFGNCHDYGRIYGFKYMDLEPTGVLGAEDDVLGGVTIRLYKADGTFVAETETAADGSFSFEDLLSGSYYVTEVVPDGWTQTSGPVGPGDAVDVTPGGEVGPINFLNTPPYDPLSPVIFGHKYRDTDNDGVHDVGEPGMGGWTIELYYKSDGVWKRVATTVTDSTGSWEFRALPDGSPLPNGEYYVVEVIPEGSDWKQTFGPRGSEDSFTVDDTVQIDYGPFDFGNADDLKWMPFTGGNYTLILLFAIVSMLAGVMVRQFGKQMARG